jgi:hypothetical protein
VNLRVTGDEPDRRFDDQLTAMIQAREDGLIGGVGLSNITLQRLRRALERTPIACVQNPLNLADRSSMPVLRECAARGIAFVPFFLLGSAFARDNPVLGNPAVRATAGRLGATPAQIALAWTLSLAPNVLLIPGTSSVPHLEENSQPPTSRSTSRRSGSSPQPAPAQPRRRPPGQPRTVADRDHPAGISPGPPGHPRPGGSGGCLSQPGGLGGNGWGEGGWRGPGERQQGTGQPGQGGAEAADVAGGVHDDLLGCCCDRSRSTVGSRAGRPVSDVLRMPGPALPGVT